MLRIAQMAAIVLAMLVSQAGAQNLEAANVENLRAVLSGYHDVPGPDYWQKLDQDAARAALLQLSSSESENIHIRTRATHALVNFANEEVERKLSGMFNSSERGYLRAAALKAYSMVASQKAAPLLEKALADHDDVVRISAIRSLGEMGGAEAIEILERAMNRENDPVTRNAMARSLQKIAPR